MNRCYEFAPLEVVRKSLGYSYNSVLIQVESFLTQVSDQFLAKLEAIISTQAETASRDKKVSIWAVSYSYNLNLYSLLEKICII
jgi:hypothetical protein